MKAARGLALLLQDLHFFEGSMHVWLELFNQLNQLALKHWEGSHVLLMEHEVSATQRRGRRSTGRGGPSNWTRPWALPYRFGVPKPKTFEGMALFLHSGTKPLLGHFHFLNDVFLVWTIVDQFHPLETVHACVLATMRSSFSLTSGSRLMFRFRLMAFRPNRFATMVGMMDQIDPRWWETPLNFPLRTLCVGRC